jgi:trehalose-6-phosphate synthase/Kef-type K+ transport system membrane component KefB
MKRLAALALIIATVLGVRALRTAEAGPAGTALALGFALLGAWITGDLLRRFHLPRLTGYLLFGVVTGPYLANVISEAMAVQLQVVTGIATTLIALIAGLSLNVNRLGERFSAIARLTATTSAIAILGLGAALWLLWPWLPVAPDTTGVAKAVMVSLVAVILVSFSPTMTAAVTTETGSRGPLSELVLAMVLIADLAVLALFSLLMQIARLTFGSAPDINVLIRFAWEIGGAISVGVLFGSVFALYLRYIGREVTLALLVLCALLSQAGTMQQFEPLLAAVAAGVTIENLAIAQGDALKTAVQRGALPVLVIFFVAVGASLRLDALTTMGPLAAALGVLRVLLIRIGVRVGTRASNMDRGITRYAWTGLISQAGVTLGLASVIAREFPSWGTQVQLLVVALIALHELSGPLLFRYGLSKAGAVEARVPRPLIVVSNREPYLHDQASDGRITAAHATGGVAVALDALMRERGGIWIAHGSGPADRLVVDADDKVRVPPDSPAYALRRLWIEEPTFSAYYAGFANEGLWPLCHLVDVRPQFRAEDWQAYQDVNDRFAAAIDEELTSTTTPVFIQDYHLTLVAPALRRRRPQARTALFWHIPWPYPDRLRICPWRRTLLEGLLANDLLAFQLERDRRNFLLAIEEETDLDADVDPETSSVRLGAHTCSVVAVPIGVDYDRIQRIATAEALVPEQDRLVSQFALNAPILGIGVDRLDYTKGIPERLAAIEEIVTRRPELEGRLTFLQIGVPSRSDVGAYAALEHDIDRTVSAINRRHAIPGRPPLICYQKAPLTLASLVALYRLAHFCVVSSLHDGMNLVAKEFVAARDDEAGVLVLSALAGAAQELKDALLINPYDVNGFADALLTAIDMPTDEQRARMRLLRRVVAGRNVFGWASDILEGLESLWSKPLHYSVREWEETAV